MCLTAADTTNCILRIASEHSGLTSREIRPISQMVIVRWTVRGKHGE